MKHRSVVTILTSCLCVVIYRHLFLSDSLGPSRHRANHDTAAQANLQVNWDDGRFHWANVPQHYPLSSFTSLPAGNAAALPKIQHSPWYESRTQKKVREARQAAVLGNFTHAWSGYKQHAWLKDEVGPLTGKVFDHFGGWAATLVDSLDTLWIMGLKDEFESAVDAIEDIDFSTCALEELNVFETTIRYMGGLLSAWDLSEGQYPALLDKVLELGEMIYKSFDTPNRMPITRWKFQAAKAGKKQQAPDGMMIAELGSLTVEMTRLSQVTGNPKYYDAVQRITDHLEEQQMKTQLPGLFPVIVDPRALVLTEGSWFTLGGMVDSIYEYLPKEYLLLGGGQEQYRRLYERAMEPIRKHMLYRPMTPDNRDILLSGQASVGGQGEVYPEAQGQHLACFVGGMIGLGAKAFNLPDDMALARKVVDGCIWGYETGPMGIFPEIIHTVPCPREGECRWDEQMWHQAVDEANYDGGTAEQKIAKHHLPPGVSKIDDTRYGLRPEAIESVFILYRLTGDQRLADKAWQMFNSITAATTTSIGAAALSDCTNPDLDSRTDSMESFWFAETLKYFYLIFSEPDLVSLDEWVLNTEAHPFRRPRADVGSDRQTL